MKKIMFNDRYNLTQAVLDGSKTTTRRLNNFTLYEGVGKEFTEVPHENLELIVENGFWLFSHNGHPLPFLLPRLNYPCYKVGEVVAIAQSYGELYELTGDKKWLDYSDTAGWNNKMFVKADLMPYKIQITALKAERLQDISDEDCLKEGIWEWINVGLLGKTYWYPNLINSMFRTPRAAFAALIDKVSGKGTWESNPWVWVYEFQLVK